MNHCLHEFIWRGHYLPVWTLVGKCLQAIKWIISLPGLEPKSRPVSLTSPLGCFAPSPPSCVPFLWLCLGRLCHPDLSLRSPTVQGCGLWVLPAERLWPGRFALSFTEGKLAVRAFASHLRYVKTIFAGLDKRSLVPGLCENCFLSLSPWLCYLSSHIPLPEFSCLYSIGPKLFIFSFKALKSLRVFFLSIICPLSLLVIEMSAPGPIQPSVPNGADPSDLDLGPRQGQWTPLGPRSLVRSCSCGAFTSAEAFWLQGWERDCMEPALPAAEPGWMSLPSVRGGRWLCRHQLCSGWSFFHPGSGLALLLSGRAA